MLEIKKDIFWVGAVDWNIRDFHGYSTPKGTTYNAYLIKGANKTVLVDTVKHNFFETLIDHIKKTGIQPEKIDYLLVNHVEMDHSGSIKAVIDLIKPEKIICSANGKKALIKHFHREDWPYEVVTTNDTINIGGKTLKFIETKMIHWPDSMFTYIPEDKLLISQDGFGQHWATSERFDDEVDLGELIYHSTKYYANILMLYSSLIRNAIKNIIDSGIEIDMIAPDHGLIWRSNIDKILNAYGKWVNQETKSKAVVIFDTMWQSTEKMANALYHGLLKNGAGVKVMNLKHSHRSDVMTEVLDSKAVIIGSPTLNNGMMPTVADILCYMRGLRPSGRIGAAFGSYGWGGESLKLINTQLQEIGIKLVDDGIRINYVPTDEELNACFALGEKIADAMVSEE